MSSAKTHPEIHDALFAFLDVFDAVHGGIRVSYEAPDGKHVHIGTSQQDLEALYRARRDLLAALDEAA